MPPYSTPQSSVGADSDDRGAGRRPLGENRALAVDPVDGDVLALTNTSGFGLVYVQVAPSGS